MDTENTIDSGRPMTTLAAALLTLAMTTAASAQSAPPQKHAGKIICGSFSGDPRKYPAWSDDMAITIERGALIATPSRPQGQVMVGVVAPSGAILMAGEGGVPGGPAEWTYEFSGKLNPNGPTVLRGQLANIMGGGARRQCSVTF